MFIDVEEQSDDVSNSRLSAQHKETSMNIDKHFAAFSMFINVHRC